MNRIVLLLLSALATISMLFPCIETSGTEIGFPAGSPDPNIYSTTLTFGLPLEWLICELSLNTAAGYDETTFRLFDVRFSLIYVASIAAPLLLALRVSQKQGDVCGFQRLASTNAQNVALISTPTPKESSSDVAGGSLTSWSAW